MARLSVYVPDELLEHAKALAGSENTSALIQRGLQRLVDDEKATPPYARRPEQSFQQIIDLRERLLAEARADYEVGYSIALEAATGMSLHVLNHFVEQNFDLEKWLKSFMAAALDDLIQNSGPPIEDPKEIGKALLERAAGPPLTPDAFKSSDWWWVWKTAEALGKFASPMDFDEFMFTPTQARQRGYSDALFELWSAIEEPGSSWADSLAELSALEENHTRNRAGGGEAARRDTNAS
ncbi:MAG: hypothetical protein ACYDHH_34490 [Solirubrobacteraceae bacterium]